MSRHFYCLPALLICGSVFAQNDIFLCTDERGNKTYQNVGTGKGCKRVDVPSLNSMPTQKGAPKAAGGGAKSDTPSNFPKVDGNTQKERDNDRKRIWEDELKAEEAKLAELKKEYNNGEPERRGDERNYQKYQERVQKLKEDIARTEANIAALRKQLGR